MTMMKRIRVIYKIWGLIFCFLFLGGVIAGYIDKKNNKYSNHTPYGIYEAYFKRPLDFICGMLALLIFWWLYLIVALIIKIKLGSPVLFVQERPGLDGKIFKLYKFRSMTDERDENGELLPDDKRLTKLGKMLRVTSLDELPEAFNIIKGEMSVIGPRPLAVQYLPYYTDNEMRRHTVKPGLSGWAQINGRTSASWDQRFQYDIEYVDNITFLFDLKIIIKTIKKVVKCSDIVEAGTQGDFDKYRINQREEKEL